MSILVGESDAKARHAKIVVAFLKYVPGEIAHESDVPRDADFQTATELADRPCVSVVNRAVNKIFTFINVSVPVDVIWLDEKLMGAGAALGSTEAGPCIRSKARATDRVTECHGEQSGAANVVIAI